MKMSFTAHLSLLNVVIHADEVLSGGVTIADYVP